MLLAVEHNFCLLYIFSVWTICNQIDYQNFAVKELLNLKCCSYCFFLFVFSVKLFFASSKGLVAKSAVLADFDHFTN